MRRWTEEGLDVPRVSVNVSVQQIERETLIEPVIQVLRATGMEPARLELEVTESTIMREPEKSISMLGDLKAMGIQLAIDDFGTGHSSLAYLKRLPLDRLKIDQSFVRDIGQDTNGEAISQAIIGLARTLGLETIAEGVEREEQAEFLRQAGCDFVQGYLYGRPVPAAALREAWSVAATEPGDR